ncbi:acyltransferase [Halobaculum litoreum]|uniref:Acyltransferase n=1 Tax=Halobaculum litoreum TaxID=3031998 RepID=A0ABD5XR16_9EURY|nr:acyltransferase [Halobaculum sp. DT92]
MSRLLKALYVSVMRRKNAIERRWFTLKVREVAEETGEPLRVNGPSRVNSNTVLDDNVNFNGLQVMCDGRLTIGDNSHSGPGVRILTRNHNHDAGTAIPYDDTYVRNPVRTGDNVWLGVDTTVLPGVEIGEGAIVQAGSTVVDDVPSGAIVGGHPAEQFAERDMDHYNRLKEQGRFH